MFPTNLSGILARQNAPQKSKNKKQKKWELEEFFNFNFFWEHFVLKISLLF
jgi:hypothetical protein